MRIPRWAKMQRKTAKTGVSFNLSTNVDINSDLIIFAAPYF
jgi:hypothetical protein